MTGYIAPLAFLDADHTADVELVHEPSGITSPGPFAMSLFIFPPAATLLNTFEPVFVRARTGQRNLGRFPQPTCKNALVKDCADEIAWLTCLPKVTPMCDL